MNRQCYLSSEAERFYRQWRAASGFVSEANDGAVEAYKKAVGSDYEDMVCPVSEKPQE